MSTSGEQENRPLTRRELRELRARGGSVPVRGTEASEKDTVVEPAPAADQDGADQDAASVRGAVAEAGPAVEQEPAAEAPEARGPNVVATSAQEGSEVPPLTRRELRRLRTNEMPVIEIDDDPSDSPSAAVDDPAVAINVISEVRTDPDEATAAQSSPADDDAEPNTTVIPALSPTFGAGVGNAVWAPDESASFDDIMERHVTTSPSSIIMTSSHRLADGIGSTGAAKGTTDGRDVDAVLLDGELPPSSSPTPIAASSAISTQKAAHEVIRPPTPDKGRGLLMVLGITAGGLGIVAIGTLITLYFTGVFNQ
ncbi:MAG: hypothetical protein ACTH9L_10095 [Microbacterium gubbeenense]